MLAVASPGASAQLADGLRLQVEKHLRMAPARPERDAAKFLEADRIEGQPDKVIVATGNVTLRQRGASIRADRLEYASEDQKAVATGNVTLERNGDTAVGPRLDYDLANDTGEMASPVFEFPKKDERRTASRGWAARAELSQNQVSRLFQAEYTSCPAPRDDWVLRVRELEVDTTRNVGTAYNTAVYFLGVPILYSPWLSFPLDNKRKSGFLAPTLGTSGKSGFEFALPYYWNIAENRDATITPKVFTKRGIQLGGELRYLQPSFSGQFDGEFLPHDRIADADRYFLGLRHSHHLWGRWSAALNAQKVSDDDYFRDLSTRIAATSQVNLPRDAIVSYGGDVWTLQARALAYQTLQDPSGAPVAIPYRLMPRLAASGFQQNVYGFDWRAYGEAASFSHPTLVNGERAIAYPSIAYPLRRTWGYVVPKTGFHYTRYNIGEHGEGYRDASRSLPISSLDAGLFFERAMSWGERAFQQTLEPRAYYLYVPYRDQSRLPNFTTVETDFNFAQIFNENRFVGGDRIGDANQLTLAVTSRLIEASTGLERFKASLGQVYYFSPPRVTLNEPVPENKSSDIVALASSQMAPSVTAEAGIQYTPTTQHSQKLGVGAQYNPEPGKILNAAYRYSREAIEQLDVSSQWPVLRNVSALARVNYSFRERKVLEGLVGFEYNAGCWQLRAVAHRFITAANQYSTSFQIQLELTGLSRIGINPLETIRQNISGYRRIEETAP
jgi:LPS-assembly protein